MCRLVKRTQVLRRYENRIVTLQSVFDVISELSLIEKEVAKVCKSINHFKVWAEKYVSQNRQDWIYFSHFMPKPTIFYENESPPRNVCRTHFGQNLLEQLEAQSRETSMNDTRDSSILSVPEPQCGICRQVRQHCRLVCCVTCKSFYHTECIGFGNIDLGEQWKCENCFTF